MHKPTPDLEVQALVAGLRALADQLERGDLPVSPYSRNGVFYHVPGTDEEQAAEVARVARLLGVPVQDSNDHLTVQMNFGPFVRYEACAVQAAARARYPHYFPARAA